MNKVQILLNEKYCYEDNKYKEDYKEKCKFILKICNYENTVM